MRECATKLTTHEWTLVSFVLVAGDNAINNFAGTEPARWNSILQHKGCMVETHLGGLGEYEEIWQIAVGHARAALEKDRL